MIRLLLISCILISGLFSQSSEEIKRRIRESGMSESQLRQLAKQRGMTDADIDTKAQELGLTTQIQESLATKQVIGIVPSYLPTERVNQPTRDTLLTEIFAKRGLEFFGYDIFERDPAIFQGTELGAVDPGYNIGPGDEVIIMLWGETQFRQVLAVDREGFIFIPEVGQVFVNGLTMSMLESKLFKVLSQKYSSLIQANGGNPTTFLDVSLGNMRPLRVLVVGEVAQPGAYRVSPSTTLFTSLYYFNGPNPLGTLRDIRLIRNGKETASIDFYDYLLSGRKINDTRLQLDDTIFLPHRGKTVSIRGEINRPAIYELKEGEGLLDLIDLAGDFTTKAYLNRIQIDRIVPVEKRKILGMDRMVVDVDIINLKVEKIDFGLLDGDTIDVFTVKDLRENYVDISGNVFRPGRYELIDELKISNLVELADGISNDTYLDIAHLVRVNDDLTKNLYELNLGNAIKGVETDNMVLQPFDSLIVFNRNSIYNAFKTINLSGAVKKPGAYAYYDGMTIKDLLIQAGGFANDVYRVKLEVMRVNPDSTSENRFGFVLAMPDFLTIDELGQNFHNNEIGKLQPHDVVFVRADPNFILGQKVKITGAVAYPGEYALLTPNDYVSDIVQRAGGLKQEAYPEASSLIRDSIEVNIDLAKIMARPRSKIDFTVLAGDEIHVLRHPNMVFVYGQVSNPGAFKFLPGYSVRDYINEAGGYNSSADRRDVSIRYPNGEGDKVKQYWFTPSVIDGSIITVAADMREEVDKTELAKEITSILANLAQIIAIVILAQPR